MRYLDTILEIRLTTKGGDVVERLNVEDLLEEEERRALVSMKEVLASARTGLPISPVDTVAKTLEEAGYKVGEISGRKTTLEDDPDTGKMKVKSRKRKGPRKTAAMFNAGQYDVLLINKSGSTGISLHASEKFKDQRQRVMISAQSQLDVNDEVQMRGRIDRTGQVKRGAYIYITSHIPAEQRIQLMLRRKMKSLDANTTSSQKSEFSDGDTPDIVNKYGDQAVMNVMKRNKELCDGLGIAIDEKKQNGLAESILKAMVLIDADSQAELLDEVMLEYESIVGKAVEEGSYDLELSAMDLDAIVERRSLWKKGVSPGSGNQFADNAYLDLCDIKTQRKPYTAQELEKEIRKLNTPTDLDLRQRYIELQKKYEEHREKIRKELAEEAERKAEAARNEAMAKRKGNLDIDMAGTDAEIAANQARNKAETASKRKLDKLQKNFDIIKKVYASGIMPGDMVWERGSSVFGKGCLLGYHISETYSAATSYAVIAVSGGGRRTRVPLNEFANLSVESSKTSDEERAKLWNEMVKSPGSDGGRESCYIATGNLLTASAEMAKKGLHGRIISYTTHSGETRLGILMPHNFKPEELTELRPISEVYEDVMKGVHDQCKREIKSSDKKVSISIKQNSGGKTEIGIQIKKTDGVLPGGYRLVRAFSKFAFKENEQEVKIVFSINKRYSYNEAEDTINEMLKILDKEGITAETTARLDSVAVDADSEAAERTMERIISNTTTRIDVPDVLNLLNWLDKDGKRQKLISIVAGAMKKSGQQVRFRPMNGSIKGYATNDGRIVVDSTAIKSEEGDRLHVLLHELIHAFTINILEKNYKGGRTYNEGTEKVWQFILPGNGPKKL